MTSLTTVDSTTIQGAFQVRVVTNIGQSAGKQLLNVEKLIRQWHVALFARFAQG